MYDELKKAILSNDKQFFKHAGPISQTVLNTIDKEGNSLLHLAAINGSLYFVKQLLKRGANIFSQNIDGDSPLHLAVKQGHYNIVEEMLGISEAAQNRDVKKNWLDKDRKNKINTLETSQNKALMLLNTRNNQNEIPLIIAAQLPDELIYNKLLFLESAPAYLKKDIDSALSLRLKRMNNLKLGLFNDALLQTLCPAASIAELADSVAYSGLLSGACAVTVISLNAVFASISVLGFGIILYANYKKSQFEKNAVQEREILQSDLAFLKGIKKRIQQFAEKNSFTVEEQDELAYMKKIIAHCDKKPNSLKGSEKNAADYVTDQDKTLAALSTLGSFLCAYSGALGLMGLGATVTATIMGMSAAALIVSSGPIGLGIVLGIGLVLAVAIALHHYQSRKQDYMIFGEHRASTEALQSAIYREKQDLVHSSDNTLEKIDALLNKLSGDAESISSEANIKKQGALIQHSFLTRRTKSASDLTNADCFKHETNPLLAVQNVG